MSYDTGKKPLQVRKSGQFHLFNYEPNSPCRVRDSQEIKAKPQIKSFKTSKTLKSNKATEDRLKKAVKDTGIPNEENNDSTDRDSTDKDSTDRDSTDKDPTDSTTKTLEHVSEFRASKTFTSLKSYKIKFQFAHLEHAIKQNQIFTIQGGYSALRCCLKKRGWVEINFYQTRICKQHNSPPSKKTTANDDGYDNDGDDENDDNDTSRSRDKFEDIMNKMIQNMEPTFIWVMQREQIDYLMLFKNQIFNHFKHTAVFTTKVGLCLNLRNLPWYDDIDPHSFFPRCYLLCHNEEKQEFIDDFNLTTCTSILKIIIDTYTTNSQSKIGNEDIKADFSISSSHSPNLNNIQKYNASSSNCSPHFVKSSPAPSLQKQTPSASTKIKEMRPLTEIAELAVRYCKIFLRSKNNQDLDNDDDREGLSDEELTDLRNWHYNAVHCNSGIENVSQSLAYLCESTLRKIRPRWPQLYLDGKHNIWILKPGAKSRGRGIYCYDNLESILKLDVNKFISKEYKYVIQKYIERPLLIYNCKFDIRQWFVVTDWNPLTVWFYKDSYLRFCSQEFTLDDFNACLIFNLLSHTMLTLYKTIGWLNIKHLKSSIHLCNNVIQRNYKNGPRSNQLPTNNMWTHHQFKKYLGMLSTADLWEETIYPKMKKAIICSLIVSQEHVEPRKGSFELYGADFMLTDNFNPWLLEINSNPSMQQSTDVTTALCGKVLEDILKVVIDRRYDKFCETGSFELGYKQDMISRPFQVCLNLNIEGRRIKSPEKFRRQLPSNTMNTTLVKNVNHKFENNKKILDKKYDISMVVNFSNEKKKKGFDRNCFIPMVVPLTFQFKSKDVRTIKEKLNNFHSLIYVKRNTKYKSKPCFANLRNLAIRNEALNSVLTASKLMKEKFNRKSELQHKELGGSGIMKELEYNINQKIYKLSSNESKTSREPTKNHGVEKRYFQKKLSRAGLGQLASVPVRVNNDKPIELDITKAKLRRSCLKKQSEIPFSMTT